MIYLDNNATTPVPPDVIAEMERVSRTAFGNPGSRHAAGRKARQVLEDSRERLAEILDSRPSEICFTSGGTESTNIALHGLSRGRAGTIVSLPGEHPATEETLQRLRCSGRTILPIDREGLLEPDSIERVDWSGAMLATALLAHNETGVIQDLSGIASACANHDVPFHVDAVQAVGKIEISFRRLQATTLSIGAHKFYGPRGVGALLVREGVSLSGPLYGGHQERGVRPGTEPVALIAGMVKALDLWARDRESRTAHVLALRDRLEAGLKEHSAPVVVNGPSGQRLPNTLSIAFPGCEADGLLVALDLEGVCCSLGSACASGSAEPAPILLAMSAPPEVQRSTLRLTVGMQNTSDEIDEAIRRISAVVRRLRRKE